MPELAAVLMAQTGIQAAPASLSRFLMCNGFRLKALVTSEQSHPNVAQQRDDWFRLRQPRMRIEPIACSL
jgi:hypothetical protein